MAIPDYQQIMLPILRLAGDDKEHSLREAVEKLADEFKLTDEERKELLPSGKQAKFHNRVGWSRTYLEKAGLLYKPRRAHFKITDRGKSVLASNPGKIDAKYLKHFDEFLDFQKLSHKESAPEDKEDSDTSDTPEEALESAHQTLRADLAAELLDTVKQCTPAFFEQLVVDLMVEMGYGGSRKEAGEALGQARDGGIDGIIKEDRLGLDVIYLQAKRWDGPVGRPEIQKFAGALQGNRARKGIFVTASNFTKDAEEYAASIDTKIILINGNRLAELMIDYNVGVAPVTAYEVKRLDWDYFAEE